MRYVNCLHTSVNREKSIGRQYKGITMVQRDNRLKIAVL